MSDITLNRIQTKVERFKWEKSLRDFGGDQSPVLNIYWHCVAADLLNDNILADNNNLGRFHLRFFSSYASCFYYSPKLLYRLNELFDGYSRYYRYEKEESLWEEDQENYKKEMGTTLKSIAKSVRSNYRMNERINQYKEMVIDDLGAYDESPKRKYLPISEYIIHHLKKPVLDSKYVKPINDFAGYVFQFRIDSSLIESLHELGQQFLENSYTYYAMRMVDKQFQEEDGKSFSAYFKMTTSDAVTHFLRNYSQFSSDPINEKAQHIRLMYRKPNGDKLKLDSIKKNLRNKRYN